MKKFKKRKNELYDFLFSNVPTKNNIIKNKINNITQKFDPILPLTTKFGYDGPEICSNLFLISKDIIVVLTKKIYNEMNWYAWTLEIKDLNLKINFGYQKEIYVSNSILENDENHSFISIIKLINEEFSFDHFFEIDSDLDILSEEKFVIDDKGEEMIGISISENDISNYKPGTPIIIKKNNKQYLVGIINDENHYYIFNKNELLDIKKKLDIIDMKYKFYQIEKLDFTNYPINNNELNFIFQYNFINLIYLNLEKNNITTEGIIGLQNKSLGKIKYLNLSNNSIKDEGLTYLKYMENLDELILLNMNLSDKYFLYLQTNRFINKIKIIECEKSKLIMKSFSRNFDTFKLPNLTSLKFVNSTFEIHLYLKILFSCNNICSKIKELDLSYSRLTDNGLLRIKKNLEKLKNIQTINLENSKLTLKSKKYLDFFERKKIKILLNLNKLIIPNKKIYTILLGGSTISGKTCYSYYCQNQSFPSNFLTTIGVDFKILYPSFDNNIKIRLYDMARWNGRFDSIIKNYFVMADGVLLLFDISSKEDFEGLNYCLSLITDYLELEDFPVLLIANKIDLERNTEKEEIEKFQKDNELIGFFETSCKTGINVIESFNFMVDYLIKKHKKD